MAQMTEHEKAEKIANDWLDFKMNALTQMVHGDPDCDACVLARQFIRLLEFAADHPGTYEHWRVGRLNSLAHALETEAEK